MRAERSSTPPRRSRALSCVFGSSAFRPQARCLVGMRGSGLLDQAGKSLVQRADRICEIIATRSQHSGGNWIGRFGSVEHPRVLLLCRNVEVDDPEDAIEIADQAADLRCFSGVEFALALKIALVFHSCAPVSLVGTCLGVFPYDSQQPCQSAAVINVKQKAARRGRPKATLGSGSAGYQSWTGAKPMPGRVPIVRR